MEEELLGVNKKNLSQLKKMAKVLVEERTIIKRINGGEGDNIVDNGNSVNTYAIEISLMPHN